MQIIPTINFSSNLFNPTFDQSVNAYTQSFSDFLEEAEEEEQNKTEETDADRERAELAAGIYSQATNTNNNTYTLDEVCFTQNELTSLCSQLQKAGAPKSQLTGLQKLTELPGGANLGQVLRSLKGNQSETELSDDDANEITSLLNNLDPSGVLGGKVLNSIYANKPQQALRHLLEGLEEMDQSELINFSKSELLALGRGLGLNEANQQKLADLFGANDNGTLNPQDFSKAISPAQEQLLNEKSDRQKLEEALGKTLTPMLNKAHERMAKEAASNSLKSKEADHSQVMIDKTVQEHSRHLLNSILDDANERLEDQGQLQYTSQPRSQLDLLGLNSSDNPSFQNDLQGSKDHHSKSNWDELLHKVNLNFDHKPTPEFSPNNLDALAFNTQFNLNNSHPTDNLNFSRPQGTPPTLSHQVVEQVESGLFTTLKNGASRLELQLHPQELGTIAVTLTSRNGEVSAHIKADSEQTVEMLNKQAELIKANLEEQGIRIDKIEVELKEQTNSDFQNWQNMDQHNSFQEEEAKRAQLRRLRNLANIEASKDSPELERHMQGEDQSATNATRVLDKVA